MLSHIKVKPCFMTFLLSICVCVSGSKCISCCEFQSKNKLRNTHAVRKTKMEIINVLQQWGAQQGLRAAGEPGKLLVRGRGKGEEGRETDNTSLCPQNPGGRHRVLLRGLPGHRGHRDLPHHRTLGGDQAAAKGHWSRAHLWRGECLAGWGGIEQRDRLLLGNRRPLNPSPTLCFSMLWSVTTSMSCQMSPSPSMESPTPSNQLLIPFW